MHTTTPVVSIVDDDDAFCFALGGFIRSMGWRARLYQSAEQFLDSGDANVTDCLISDIRMPGMSGIEMYERLIARGIALPTIFITAYPTAELQSKVATTGALALLEKAYSAAVMKHWITIALASG